MKTMMKAAAVSVALAAIFALAGRSGMSRVYAQSASVRPTCDYNSPLCTEVYDSLNSYTGHDEPAVLFYSATPGSGNNNVYTLVLPKDPPTMPKQDGSGGTFNFQLRPAFWFGMAMCDDQSAPNPGPTSVPCTPDSDTNIYTGTDRSDPHYLGLHPGTAFMEMQFYPPGWAPWPAGISCDATKWCAALTIDSLSENMNTGQVNNLACLQQVGIEPVNFAFITKSGVAQAPANPLEATLATYTPDPTKDLFMESGDTLTVSLHDTADGFEVVIRDLTQGTTGSMKASVANRFASVRFAPTATTCSIAAGAFHPMYSTSSESTRVVWAAHSYNIAFSDEIGHFEYCSAVDANYNCISGDGAGGTPDSDDSYCFDAGDSLRVPIGGCIGTDGDFDGVPYQLTWPGTFASGDRKVHPTPVRFTSPLANGTSDFDRVAFETDLPRIEVPGPSPNNACNRTTGAGCVNPPVGASFYPIFSTYRDGRGTCQWQEGGVYIPDTVNTFGGTSTAEYGPLLQLDYPSPTGVVLRYNDFRAVLSSNPCPN